LFRHIAKFLHSKRRDCVECGQQFGLSLSLSLALSLSLSFSLYHVLCLFRLRSRSLAHSNCVRCVLHFTRSVSPFLSVLYLSLSLSSIPSFPAPVFLMSPPPSLLPPSFSHPSFKAAAAATHAVATICRTPNCQGSFAKESYINRQGPFAKEPYKN